MVTSATGSDVSIVTSIRCRQVPLLAQNREVTCSPKASHWGFADGFRIDGGLSTKERVEKALPSSSAQSELFDRLYSREAVIGVIGLGYVGLPVATTFATAGFHVIGVDTHPERVRPIKEGRSYLHDVESDDIAQLQAAGRFRVTSSYRALSRADAVLICVPTPLLDGNPDLSAIRAAGSALARVMRMNTLIVLESTSYPGTTEEVLLPLLEAGGLVAGRDFLVAFSPERIDPGNPHYGFQDIPKIVGGVTPEATRAAEALYSAVVPKVVTVSGAREAELTKLVENTFRHVNIALVNELTVYAHELGIDIWEAIEAASTKPFGFMPFWPSPGWGGHCIPLDPSYLSWRVRKHRAHDVRFVELAHTVNGEMTRHVLDRTTVLLNNKGLAVRGSKILAVGASYKAATEDTRGSPGIKLLSALAERGAEIAYHDPLVRELTLAGRNLISQSLTKRLLNDQDLVVILVRQEGVNWDLLLEQAPSIFDCCNALGRREGKITRL
jgi:UDP-N-acetyl-D-glucosamine dehydrogenase